MYITKTNFINYLRCSKYVALEEVKQNKMRALVTYNNEELILEDESRLSKIREYLQDMYSDDGEDLLEVDDPQLKAMLPYYTKIELIAGEYLKQKFGEEVVYSSNTKEQKSFTATIDDYKYICYLDGYQEQDNGTINIFEVKATTSNKFLKLGTKEKSTDTFISIFDYDSNHILKLREEIKDDFYYTDFFSGKNNKNYLNQRNKLFDRYSDAGKYVYDLAFERYVIEHQLISEGKIDLLKNIKYYLVVLNPNYIYDGYLDERGEIEYRMDQNSQFIIDLVDLTTITNEYQEKIELDRLRVENYIESSDLKDVPYGEYCQFKKTRECKYMNVCFGCLKEKNSIYSYIEGHNGFMDELGQKHSREDLINEGKVQLLDVPLNYLNRKKNEIQRNVVETSIPYVHKSKLQKAIDTITYPIYHLDFETFPCPLPRFKGEKVYTQSVFQFSIHIEREEGICDKNKDHFEYLARDASDHRLKLIQKMIEVIDINSGGTVLVYNENFEKSRLKELAEIFPEYKHELLKIRDMVFDLLYVLKSNTKLFMDLGFSEEESKLFNYYHTDLSGSFSIKKVLPVFTDLTYNDLEVANGIDALVTYATFPYMTQEEKQNKILALIEYCKQDTWAMVEILNGIRKLVKE